MDIKPVTWSHSALKDYEGCARRYHNVRILTKYPFEETEQIRYGKELHKAAEDYVKEDKPIPEQFKFMVPILQALTRKAGRKFAEHQMALTSELKVCDWFAKDVWVRGVADLLIIDDDNLTAWVVDYKTGNDKYPDRDQLTLMSLLVFAHFPHIRQVNSALLFVVKDSMVKAKMSYDEQERAWWDYRERVGRIEASSAANVWNPSQSPLCNWCPCTDCEHHPRH